MSTDRHQRLATWFEGASKLSGAERDAWIARGRAEAPDVVDQLCKLLGDDTRGDAAIDEGLDSGGAAAMAAEVLGARGVDADPLAAGDAVGPYTVR